MFLLSPLSGYICWIDANPSPRRSAWGLDFAVARLFRYAHHAFNTGCWVCSEALSHSQISSEFINQRGTASFLPFTYASFGSRTQLHSAFGRKALAYSTLISSMKMCGSGPTLAHTWAFSMTLRRRLVTV